MSNDITSCCYASGGRAEVAINGQAVSPRTVMVNPIPFERDVASNQDGTIYTKTKPMPAEAELTISDFCGFDITSIMACPADITITLLDLNRTYLFTRAVVVGRPKLNTETGEWSNIKVTSNTVTITNN